jgi:hypothetical protein
MSYFQATMAPHLSTVNLKNSHFFEMWIFWQPGNLTMVLHGASTRFSLFCSLMPMQMNPGQCEPWPTCAGYSQKAPLLLVWSLDWEQYSVSDRNVHWKEQSPRSPKVTHIYNRLWHFWGGFCLHPLHTGQYIFKSKKCIMYSLYHHGRNTKSQNLKSNYSHVSFSSRDTFWEMCP